MTKRAELSNLSEGFGAETASVGSNDAFAEVAGGAVPPFFELKSQTSRMRSTFDQTVFVWLRAIALLAVLEKNIGPRFFLPQISSGEVFELSRPVYYAEFFVSLFVIFLSIVHLRIALKIAVKNIDIIIFFLCVFITEAFGESVIDSSSLLIGQLYLLNYIEAFLAVGLVIQCDGIRTAQKILLAFFSLSLFLNATSIALPWMSFTAGGDLAGTFRGLTRHRGDLAYFLNVAFLVTVCYARNGLARIVLVAAITSMIILSRSAQGSIFLVLSIVMLWLLKARGEKGFIRPVGLTFLAALTIVPTIYTPDWIADFLEIFGRDTSFTGRTDIWNLAIYMIDQVPLWGYGIGNFSDLTFTYEIKAAYRLQYISFGSTHSSYLEAVYSLGYIGGVAFFVCVGRTTFQCLKTYLSSTDVMDRMPYVLTLLCVIGGIFAAEKLFSPGAGWLSFMLARQFMAADKARPRRWQN